MRITVFFVGALMASLFGHVPQPVGARNELAPCPATPNCVSSDSTRRSQQVPVVPFTDDAKSAQARARAALLAEPRSTITFERDGFLRGECRSMLFRFVDDVDIVIDPVQRVFRFRSASRVGRSDLGVNRKRAERLIARLQTAAAKAAP